MPPASSSGKQEDMLQLMKFFYVTGDIIVYLEPFERQISTINLVKENWIMYLLSLCRLEIVNIVPRESDPKDNNYDYVKQLLL